MTSDMTKFLSSEFKEYEFQDKRTGNVFIVQAKNKQEAEKDALNLLGCPKKNLVFIEKHEWEKLKKVV
jgi:hypothetical protein